jgi:hypothetical protein
MDTLLPVLAFGGIALLALVIWVVRSRTHVAQSSVERRNSINATSHDAGAGYFEGSSGSATKPTHSHDESDSDSNGADSGDGGSDSGGDGGGD